MGNAWLSICVILTLWIADKVKCRSIVGMFPTLIAIAGGAMVWGIPRQHKVARLIGFYLSLAFAIPQFVATAFLAVNIAGRTKKTWVTGMFREYFARTGTRILTADRKSFRYASATLSDPRPSATRMRRRTHLLCSHSSSVMPSTSASWSFSSSTTAGKTPSATACTASPRPSRTTTLSTSRTGKCIRRGFGALADRQREHFIPVRFIKG